MKFKVFAAIAEVNLHRGTSSHVSILASKHKLGWLWIFLAKSWEKFWVENEGWRCWEFSIWHLHWDNMSSFTMVFGVFVLGPRKLTLINVTDMKLLTSILACKVWSLPL